MSKQMDPNNYLQDIFGDWINSNILLNKPLIALYRISIKSKKNIN